MVAAHLTHDFGWGKQLIVQQDLHLAAHAPHLFSGHTQKEVSPAVGPMPRIRSRIASSNKPRLHEATTAGTRRLGSIAKIAQLRSAWAWRRGRSYRPSRRRRGRSRLKERLN